MYIEFGLGRKMSTKSYPSILRDDSMLTFFAEKYAPRWFKFNRGKNLIDLLDANPVLFGVLSTKARYQSNVKIMVKDIKTGELFNDDGINKSSYPKIARKMLDLMSNPNPLQSTLEFLSFASMSKDLHANGFFYGTFDDFSKHDIDTIVTIKNLWSHRMEPKMTGRILSATKISDVVEYWEFTQLDGSKRPIDTRDVLHRRDATISLDRVEDYVMAKSKCIPLDKPLSTIMVNLESLNIIGKERGMTHIISSAKKDPRLGQKAMNPEERREIEKDLQTEHGLLEGQNKFLLTKQHLTVTTIETDINKLGLQPQIIADAKLVCAPYGLPPLLLGLDSNATYENLKTSERQLYQGVTIPETIDLLKDISQWLHTYDYGFEYVPSFDHIAVLQENIKDRAISKRNIDIIEKSLFHSGGSTLNEWRKALGRDEINDSFYNKRLTEMTDREYAMIAGRDTASQNPVSVNGDSKKKETDK